MLGVGGLSGPAGLDQYPGGDHAGPEVLIRLKPLPGLIIAYSLDHPSLNPVFNLPCIVPAQLECHFDKVQLWVNHSRFPAGKIALQLLPGNLCCFAVNFVAE